MTDCVVRYYGSEFTNRLQPYEKRNRYDEHPVETWCRENRVYHRRIPPGEKELNGKVERSHRIDEDYFYWKVPRNSLQAFNYSLDRWIDRYNRHRPHGGLKGLTPAQKLIERRLRLPFDEVDPRFFKAKLRYLREIELMENSSLYLLQQLDSELECYNAGIRGLDASGKS